MKVLPESWWAHAQTGRPSVNIYKLAGLLIGVTVMTAFWLLALMLAFYAVGSHAGASFFVGVGLVIAALSGAGLALVMANR